MGFRPASTSRRSAPSTGTQSCWLYRAHIAEAKAARILRLRGREVIQVVFVDPVGDLDG